jgi:hypothetical protein
MLDLWQTSILYSILESKYRQFKVNYNHKQRPGNKILKKYKSRIILEVWFLKNYELR